VAEVGGQAAGLVGGVDDPQPAPDRAQGVDGGGHASIQGCSLAAVVTMVQRRQSRHWTATA
jgi:hypothetical protein